jgi:hypothetical protein
MGILEHILNVGNVGWPVCLSANRSAVIFDFENHQVGIRVLSFDEGTNVTIKNVG